jgi:trimethylamine---corrinoid protein Co-methyltransferase
MQPKLSLLDDALIARILDEAYQLMLKPGIKVQNAEARKLLAEAGADVNEETHVVRIPEQIVRKALETVPRQFYLYDYDGNPTVQYGGDAVHFDPGSSGISVLIPETLEHKTAETEDLLRVIKVTESLPQYDAQSTAVVCHDVPKDIHDLYRLYLVMMYSKETDCHGRVHEPDRPCDDRHARHLCGRTRQPAHQTARHLRCLPLAAVDLVKLWRGSIDRTRKSRHSC